mmetsp:Transcript_68861/g.224351  ORF Transcript_68861/g.224351 Transcript_68861/m.224351 type:complete len:216 (-) Transcript_68861:1225-1872(-)
MSSSRLLAIRLASTARKSSCLTASRSPLLASTSSSFALREASISWCRCVPLGSPTLPSTESPRAILSGWLELCSIWSCASSSARAELSLSSRELRSSSVSRWTLLACSASIPAKSSRNPSFSMRAWESWLFNCWIVMTCSSSEVSGSGASVTSARNSSSPSKSCRSPISSMQQAPPLPVPSTLVESSSSSSILVSSLTAVLWVVILRRDDVLPCR